MIYTILADAVVIFHLLFIIYALAGGLLYFWRSWLVFFHIPAAMWIVIVEINHWVCPLTPLENTLRDMGNTEMYSGDFISHYILPVIYPPGLTENTQVLLALAAFTVNAIIYAMIIRNYIKKHKR